MAKGKGKGGKKGKKEKGKAAEGPELYPLDPVNYLTEDFRTSIQLFSTSNETIRLRAIGRLHKCILEDEKLLDYIVSKKLYPQFVKALNTENVYIIRFATSVLQMITENNDFLKAMSQDELHAIVDAIRNIFLQVCGYSNPTDCASLVFALYSLLLQTEDPLLKELTTFTLRNLLMSPLGLINYIYNKDVMAKVLELIRTTDDLDIQEACLKMFLYLLGADLAESELLTIPTFSLQVILCFMQSSEISLQNCCLDILHKLALWMNPAILKLCCEFKVMELATNVLVTNMDKNQQKAYNVLYACLRNESADVQYSKTLEFLKFLEWAKVCKLQALPYAAHVITHMTRNENLLQLLSDFDIDQIVLALLTRKYEPILGGVCEAISNLLHQKYLCIKMTNPEMMEILADIIHDDCISTVPYGELALKTLHKFFMCNAETVNVVCNSEALSNLLEMFYTAHTTFTFDGYTAFLEIMQLVVRSPHVKKILNICLYTALLEMFRDITTDACDKVVGIVKDLLIFEEFRHYFIERDGVEKLLEKLRKETCYERIYALLLMVKFLIKYKVAAGILLDNGIVLVLIQLNELYKNRTCLCDEILQTLYDLCLTLKFFYTGRLSPSDRIRDQFYMLPHSLFYPTKTEKEAVDQLTCSTPIYVVLYGSLMRFEAYRYATRSRAQKHIKRIHYKAKMRDRKCQVLDTNDAKPVRDESLHVLDMAPPKKIRINLDPSYVSTKFVHGLCKLHIKQKPTCEITMPKSKYLSQCTDRRLSRFIRTVYQELFFSSKGPKTLEGRISFVAKYVHRKLSRFKDSKTKVEKKHTLRLHQMQLKDLMGSNFVPLGYLRLGLTCERALLFKVICDHMHISTSLNHNASGICWNGVYFIKANVKETIESATSVEFIVDLMSNVGEFIPVNTSSAMHYFQQNAQR